MKLLILTILTITSVMQIPKSDYDRHNWGAWIDADSDCQDTRQEVLIEESLLPVTFKTKKNCKVATGLWYCDYTGRLFTNPSKLDIDHMVPLFEAYLSGGYHWSADRKHKYANYLKDQNHLKAVYRGANRSKGAKDPSEWMPDKAPCEYVSVWIEIKNTWNLDMDDKEHHTIDSILTECGNAK